MSLSVEKHNADIIRNDAVIKAKIETLIDDNNRSKIKTRNELLEYKPGSPISYITKDKIFHCGGFLKKIKTSSFVVVDLKEEKEIVVKFDDVRSMYVGKVDEVVGDIISFSPPDAKETNFPVKLGNFVVYYGRSKFDMRRFKNTKKFKNMEEWFDMFGKYYENIDD